MAEKAELGVLFVHGIGEQTPGQTLIHGADPIFKFLEPYLSRQSPHSSLGYQYGSMKAEANAPPHAMALVRTNEPDCECRILLAEAFWADAFVVPPAAAFRRWTIKVLPHAMGRHFAQRAARAWNRGSFWGRLEAAARVLQLEAAWMLSPLILVVAALLEVVRIIPIDAIRETLTTIQVKMTATLGDSFAILWSALNEISIKTQVRKSLEWLAPQVQRIVVVAHSQGAAIAAFTLRDNPMPEAKRLITYGSGVRKLFEAAEMQENGDSWHSGWAAIVSMPLMAFSIWAIAVWATGQQTVSPRSIFTAVGLLLLGALLHYWGLRLSFSSSSGPAGAVRLAGQLHEQGVRWTEFYSSHDPVSNGPICDDELPGLDYVEVANERSPLRDHSLYWRNRHEFVPAVAALIFEEMPGPLGRILDGQDLLNEVRLRRRQLADIITIIRICLLIAMGLVLAFAGPTIERGGMWLIGVIHWLHSGWRGFLGTDMVGALPDRSRAVPYQAGLILLAATLWVLYRVCMWWWGRLERVNFDALAGARTEQLRSGNSSSLALPIVILLFVLIAVLPKMSDDLRLGIFVGIILAAAAWVTVRDTVRRERASRSGK